MRMWLSFFSVKAEMRGRHVETHVTVKKRAYGRKKGGKTRLGERKGEIKRRRKRRRKNRDTLSV